MPALQQGLKTTAPDGIKIEKKSDNLANLISKQQDISVDIIAKWNSLTNLIRERMIVGYKDVTPVIAEKYIFDFYGLLKYELKIPDDMIYPHILANGYFSSTEYEGNILRIALLDNERLSRYLKLFYNKKNTK